MDFLDPAKRRRNERQLMVGYVLMAILLILATVILAFVTFGFGIDRKSGEVIQKSMLFVESIPQAADIYLDDGLLGDRTDARLLLNSGSYKVSLKKSGYQSWSKSTELQGGRVERLDYPWLVPEKLVPEALTTYTAAPRFLSQSRDRRWLLIARSEGFVFDLVDTNAGKPSANPISLPTTLISQAEKNGSIEVVEWAGDNRRVLLKRTYDDSQEYYIFDISQPELSINLTTYSQLAGYEMSLKGLRPDQIYAFSKKDGTVRLIDIKLQQPPALILSDVVDFKGLDGDNIIYTTRKLDPVGTSSIRQVWYRRANQTVLVHEYGGDASLTIDGVRYDGHDYLTVNVKGESRIDIFKDPGDETDVLDNKSTATVDMILKLDGLEEFAIGQSGRFISARSGHHFAVIDLRQERKFAFDIEGGTSAKWLDGFRFGFVSGGVAGMQEFDGANRMTLGNASDGSPLFFDRDNAYLYDLAPGTNGTGTILARSRLTTTN